VDRGKVEIQNRDFHFSTAQNRLRRKEKNCRLHKTLDTPDALEFSNPSEPSSNPAPRELAEAAK